MTGRDPRDVAARRAVRRRSHRGLVISGAVIVLGGFVVAVVEAMHMPRGSIWVVVAVTALVVAGIRALTSRG